MHSDFISIQKLFMNEVNSFKLLTKKEFIELFEKLNIHRDNLIKNLATHKDFLEFLLTYRYVLLGLAINPTSPKFRFESLGKKKLTDKHINTVFDKFETAIEQNNQSEILRIINEDLTISNELFFKLVKDLKDAFLYQELISKEESKLPLENPEFLTVHKEIMSNIMTLNYKEIQEKLKVILTKTKDIAPVYTSIQEIRFMAMSSIDYEDVEEDFHAMKEIENILVERNIKLVIHIVNKFARDPMHRMDLMQEGVFGLIKAIHRFNLSRENQFSTMATHWIYHHISRYNTKTARTIKLPNHIIENIYKIKQFKTKYAALYNKQPTIETIAKELDLKEKNVRVYISMSAPEVNFQNTVNENGEELDSSTMLDNLVFDSNISPGQVFDQNLKDYEQQDYVSTLMDMIQKKTSKEQFTVLEYYFGFKDIPELEDRKPSFSEIGKYLGLKGTKVKQIINASMKQLYRDRELREFKESFSF